VHYKTVPIKVTDKLAIKIICDKKWRVCFILLVTYDVHTTRKITFIHAICYHIDDEDDDDDDMTVMMTTAGSVPRSEGRAVHALSFAVSEPTMSVELLCTGRGTQTAST